MSNLLNTRMNSRKRQIQEAISHILSEANRDPNDILADIRETENDIDRTFDNNQHLPHVKRLDKLHAEYKKVTGKRPPSQPTNESNLHELYKFAGLYARSIGAKRDLSPEEQAKGANPYLTPEGKTTYGTGPLSDVMGKQIYVQRALQSVGQMDQRFGSLKKSTENLINSIESGKVNAPTADDVLNITTPRIKELDRLSRKMVRRSAFAKRVVRDAISRLHGLPPLPGSQPKPPEEPPHYFG